MKKLNHNNSYNQFFKDKRIWISGASSGIGLSLVTTLIEAGARVVMSSRNEVSLKTISQNIASDSINYYPMDVTDKAAYGGLISYINKKFKGIDIIILNAGNCIYVDVDSFNSNDFVSMINVNYLAHVYAIEAFLPLLKQSSMPHIVPIASLSGYCGLPRASAYGPSKAAVINLAQSLQLDCIQHNISVNLVNPGFVKTPLTDKNDFPMPGLVSSDAAARYILNGIRKNKLEIYFPLWFTYFLKLISSLPACISRYLLSFTVRKKT